MMRSRLTAGLMASAAMAWLAACEPAATDAPEQTELPQAQTDVAEARFAYLTYSGQDPVFETPLAPDEARNPILAGYYPDPSVVKVGADYYLVNSSFTHYPGIPVFHSQDLITWTQIGNVIDRPGMLDFSGLTVSRGVFAPTIEFHDGRFHVITTCVDCGGNFIVTATDPAGPWSEPVWLPHIGGIDPSLFFDEDGKAYILNNDAPEGEPLYSGHRAVWIREVDPVTFEPLSDAVVAVNGGVDLSAEPAWIEGPHLYKVDGRYFLSAAEGGTGPQHSQVIFTAKSPLGPFTPHPDNPVLTQRDLPEDRPNPITSVGHADFTQDADGNWWAVFLGTRPYQGNEYNTGRETFLMPAYWDNGIPRITAAGDVLSYVIDRPDLPVQPEAPLPLTGNFTHTDTFDGDTLPLHWLRVRTQTDDWFRLEDGDLVISAGPVRLGDAGHPSLLGRRQQHTHAAASTEVMFDPASTLDEAGLAVFQNDAAYYTLGVSRSKDGQEIVRVRRRSGESSERDGALVVEMPVASETGEPVRLKIVSDGPDLAFYQAAPEGDWQAISLGQDGTMLSTDKAGGFVGTLFGLYAQSADN